MTSFDDVRPLADAVLYEGYSLYPYRASDAKNAVRWQFGVLMPPDAVALDPSERSWVQTECLLEGADGRLSIRVRFLQVQRREVWGRCDGELVPVEDLTVGHASYRPWDEAVEHEIQVDSAVADLLGGPLERSFRIRGGSDTEPLLTDGRPLGELRRRRQALSFVVRVSVAAPPGPYGVLRLRVRIDNTTTWPLPEAGDRPPPPLHSWEGAPRQRYLRGALVAAHTMLHVRGGRFLSLLDPPEWARPYADGCENIGTFPVLAGPPGSHDLILSSPIILYDHAQVAPESTTAFFDATEIDEMLALRTMTLTADEQREARGTDPRVAALLDDVHALPPDLVDRLHGTIRHLRAATSATAAAAAAEPAGSRPWWDPGADASVSPETDSVLVGDVPVARGSKVLLRPGTKRADAQDMFLSGREGTVAAVFTDVDGDTHLAVVLDDDPAPELTRAHGRYLYFAPDEVEPRRAGTGGTEP